MISNDRGGKKPRVILLALLVLLVVVAAFSAWLFLRVNALQRELGSEESERVVLRDQVDNLEDVKTTLQSQVNKLKSNNTQLQSQVDWLTGNNTQLLNQQDELIANNTQLQDQVDELTDENMDLWYETYLLKKAQLHKVDTYWFDLYPEPYIGYYGNIFNSGNRTAYNVVVTVFIYDYYGTLINSDEIHLGNIPGKEYKTFDVDIECFYDPYSVASTIDWDLY